MSRARDVMRDRAPSERLPLALWQQFAGEHGAVWAQAAVADIGHTMVHRGLGIGPVRIADGLVAPVVAFNGNVLEIRLKLGVTPALDRVTLRDLVESGGQVAAPPIRDVVFFGIWGRTRLSVLSRLSGYGRRVMLCPLNERPDPLQLAECDWRGIGVVAAADGSSDGGSGGPEWLLAAAEPRQSSESVTNLRLEQLMDAAIRAPLRRKPDPRTDALSS